jgi:predicted transcriptional regulator
MPEQAINIADNKLSILYYVHSLDIPLTNTQVTQFFLENNIMNYFDLQQLLGQLVSSEHLICLETGHKSFYSITQKGRRTLRLFQGHIPKWLRHAIDIYTAQNLNKFKRENQITAEYKRVSSKDYQVICRVMENDIVLIDLRLSVTDSKQARIICNNWDRLSLYNGVKRS